jgi:hypothetical protein
MIRLKRRWNRLDPDMRARIFFVSFLFTCAIIALLVCASEGGGPPPNPAKDAVKADDGGGVEHLKDPTFLEGTNISFGIATNKDSITINASGAGLSYWTESDQTDSSVFSPAGGNTWSMLGSNTVIDGQLRMNDEINMRGHDIVFIDSGQAAAINVTRLWGPAGTISLRSDIQGIDATIDITGLGGLGVDEINVDTITGSGIQGGIISGFDEVEADSGTFGDITTDTMKVELIAPGNPAGGIYNNIGRAGDKFDTVYSAYFDGLFVRTTNLVGALSGDLYLQSTLNANDQDITDVNSITSDGGDGDIITGFDEMETDTITVGGVPIKNFEGTNLSVTDGVLNAAGGSSEWTEIDGVHDSLVWIAPNGDSAIGVHSDGSGNTRIYPPNESDGSPTTLSMALDTIIGGGSGTKIINTSLTIGDGTASDVTVTFDTDENQTIICDVSDNDFDFSHSVTLATGKNFTIGTTQWNTGDNIDGEVIGNGTIDDDAIDFSIGDGVNITDFVGNANKMFFCNDVNVTTELSHGAADLFLMSTGTTSDPAWTAVAYSHIKGHFSSDFDTTNVAGDTNLIIAADVIDASHFTHSQDWGDIVTDASGNVNIEAGAVGPDETANLTTADFTTALRDSITNAYDSAMVAWNWGDHSGQNYLDDDVADDVDDGDIDWGSGGGQVDLADIPGGTAGANAFIFTSASLALPSGTNPTVDAAGEMAWETDDTCYRVWDGGANRAITTAKFFSMTIDNPDNLTKDTVMVLPVNAEMFPFGIKMLSVGIKTWAATSYSVNFMEYTQPGDGGTETLIETVATSTSREAEDDGTFSDADIAAGSIIVVELDTDDIDEVTVWGRFYVKTGD